MTSARPPRSSRMSLSSTLLATAAIGAAALAPSAAQAAEGFTGVTTDGRVAHFQTDTIPGLSPKPVKVTGLAAGERIVGLDRTPSGELLALTSAGNVESLDATTGKATAKFSAPVTGALDPGGPVTFAVAPDGKTARIVTANRDEIVDLATGVAKAAGGLTFAPGDRHAGARAMLAFDYEPDGRLIGIDPAQGAIAVQTAAGASTVSTLAGLPFKALEPVRATVASDGSVWAAAALPTHHCNDQPQSRFVRYEPATGKVTGVNGTYLGVQLAAVADDGQVPDDTTKPTASIRGSVVRRHVIRGFSLYGPLGVKVSDPGQVTAQLLLGGKVVASGLESTDVAGFMDVELLPRKGKGATLRRAAAAHRRAVVRMTLHDWAGNNRTYQKHVRLSR
jgi:membrane-associated protease RseP (regulator of RpoE activity)